MKTLELIHWLAVAALVATMAGCVTLDDIREIIPQKPVEPPVVEPEPVPEPIPAPTPPNEPQRGQDVVATLIPGASSQDTQITLAGYDGKQGELRGGRNAGTKMDAARFRGDVITFRYALYGPVDAGRVYLLVNNTLHKIVEVR